MDSQKKYGDIPPLVAIDWLDSYTEAGWSDIDPSDEVTTTYGLLAKKTRKWIVLAMTYCPSSKNEGYFGNLWYIPRILVQDIRIIEQPHPVVSKPSSALPPTGGHGDGGSSDKMP
tara:strand:+ start:730 stop:1074 length:345 start_codon:yes stop_codon:yes gene_type:complete